ncbi:MAG: hypothetical protein ACRC2N_02150 [Aeromonas sp.]
MNRQISFVKISRQAAEALQIADSAYGDITSAFDFIARAKGDCLHSRELAVAFIQAASDGVNRFEVIASELASERGLLDYSPSSAMEEQARLGAIRIVADVFSKEVDLLNRFAELQREIETFGSAYAN